MVMHNILKRLNFTTTQTVLVGALAIGLGSGAAFTAVHQPAAQPPKTVTVKTTDSTAPAPTDSGAGTVNTTTTSTAPTTTTSTASTSSPTPTPAASSPTTTTSTSTAPAPVTVVKSLMLPSKPGDAPDQGTCGLTYSDGTTGTAPATMTGTFDKVQNLTLWTDNCPTLVGTTK